MATDFNAMFGLTDRDEQAAADLAEGYQVGQLASTTLLNAIQTDHGHRSKAYLEGIIEGLRDNI
jgi:hypothetical protein